MSRGKSIVVTAYGHDRVIDRIAICSFDETCSRLSFNSDNNADTYCAMINSLKLEGGTWVYAKTVPENTPLDLETFLPLKFPEVLLKLNDRSIQMVLRALDKKEIAFVLKGVPNTIAEKIFRNMSSRAAQMLKEDMELMGPVRKQDVWKNQEKMLSIVLHLLDTGEIVLNTEGV